jgi:lysophospholipase L1-like esterase
MALGPPRDAAAWIFKRTDIMIQTLPIHSLIVRGLLALCGAGLCSAEIIDDQPIEKDTGTTTGRSGSLPTLWIIGDSTVRTGTPGQRGWGDELAPFFDPSKIRVVNRAIGGRSSRTFLTDGRWDQILKELRRGDFVIMQFGHNDASPINEDPPVNAATRARGVIRNNSDETVDIINILTGKQETVRSYGWYLRHFVTTAREKEATAIICSPIPRKSWNKEGKINRTTDSWTLWARQAATQAGAEFIDLNEIIARAYEQLGQEKVAALFADGTHTTAEGAAFNAQAVMSGVRALRPDRLGFALSEKGKSVTAFVP